MVGLITIDITETWSKEIHFSSGTFFETMFLTAVLHILNQSEWDSFTAFQPCDTKTHRWGKLTTESIMIKLHSLKALISWYKRQTLVHVDTECAIIQTEATFSSLCVYYIRPMLIQTHLSCFSHPFWFIDLFSWLIKTQNQNIVTCQLFPLQHRSAWVCLQLLIENNEVCVCVWIHS